MKTLEEKIKYQQEYRRLRGEYLHFCWENIKTLEDAKGLIKDMSKMQFRLFLKWRLKEAKLKKVRKSTKTCPSM